MFFRPVDEVGNDKEVTGEPHLRDHANFVLRLRFHPVWDPTGIADGETPMDFLLEIAGLGLTLWDRETWHVVCRFVKGDRCTLSDEQGVVARFRKIREKRPHLRR